jgi:hypothetical protein
MARRSDWSDGGHVSRGDDNFISADADPRRWWLQ